MNRDSIAVDPPDGGWGWVVVAGVFVSSALTFGAMISYPVFYSPIMQEFNIGFGGVTWLTGAFEIGKTLGYLSTPGLVGWLGYRGTGMLVSVASGVGISVASLGQHQWFIFMLAGTVPGFTTGVFDSLLNVVIVRYFVKRRLLAIGLGINGTSVGTLVLAPLIQYWIDSYGWRGGMLLFGGITFNVTVACALFRPIHLETDKSQEKNNSCSVFVDSGKQVLKLPKVWLLCAIFFCAYGGVRIYLRFVVPYAQEVLNVDPMKASLVLSASSIAGIFSRIGFGAIGDWKAINPVWVIIVSQLLAGVISASMWFVNDYIGVMLNNVARALLTAAVYILHVKVIVNVVGVSNVTWGYTVTGFISGMFGTVLVPLIGTLVDVTGEMRWAFIAAAILTIIGALLHIPLLKPKKKTEEIPPSEIELKTT